MLVLFVDIHRRCDVGVRQRLFLSFFFFNDTATTEIYTLSLHDALPICQEGCLPLDGFGPRHCQWPRRRRSEEHTSELQSLRHLVCRLLLEKKKKRPYCCVFSPQPGCQRKRRRYKGAFPFA